MVRNVDFRRIIVELACGRVFNQLNRGNGGESGLYANAATA